MKSKGGGAALLQLQATTDTLSPGSEAVVTGPLGGGEHLETGRIGLQPSTLILEGRKTEDMEG
jgi:hypothetical protein